jgi:hypothetical protein
MSQPLPDAWFDGVDPRRDLEAIRRALQDRLSAGVASGEVVRRLAARDHLAAAELLVGPRADEGLSRLALGVLDALEAALAPQALYRRLCDLQGRRAGEVLQAAARRHLDDRWVVGLSVRVEGPLAGRTHLRAAVGAGRAGPELERLCQAYAVQGALDGIVSLASDGRLEPLAVLGRAGQRAALVDAAARALEADPAAPVAAWLAAVWGTELRALFDEVGARLQAPAAVAAWAAAVGDGGRASTGPRPEPGLG